MRPLICLLCLAACLCAAQQEGTIDPARVRAQSQQLVLGEVGLGLGWPGYQLVHLNLALQRERFGVALRGAITEVGPYVALAGRYYLPLDFAPTFVSAGLGYFGNAPLVTAGLGVTIPFGIGSPWRLTLEGGAAVTTLLGERRVLPSVSAAIGYSFFIDQPPISAEAQQRRQEQALAAEAGCAVITPPDSSLLGESIAAALEREAAQARVAFPGYDARDVSYSYETTIDGNTAYLRGSWSATVIAPGGRASPSSGTIEAQLVWTGCSWRLVSYRLA